MVRRPLAGSWFLNCDHKLFSARGLDELSLVINKIVSIDDR